MLHTFICIRALIKKVIGKSKLSKEILHKVCIMLCGWDLAVHH